MVTRTPNDVQNQIVNLVKDFVKKDIDPIADAYDKDDIYPHELIPKMQFHVQVKLGKE